MDRKTNKHRTISWNSAAKDKSRMQGITRKRGMAEESLLVALMSKLEEMPSKAQREGCSRPRELHTWSLRDDKELGTLCCLPFQLCPTLLRPHGLHPARLFCPWGFSRQESQSGLSCPPPGDLLNLGIKCRSPTLQVDSLWSEPPGNPKNSGVGSLYLLQGIFLTQESNQGLLDCRRILYQLSYEGAQSLRVNPGVTNESQ